MHKYHYFIFFLFCSFVAVGQSPSNSLLKSLENEELLTLFNDFDGDSLAQEKIARTYLERARQEGDTVKVARGYDRLARIFHPEKNIQYADSLIEYTKNWKHITYPGLGYISKVLAYYELNDVKNAYRYSLDSYDISLKNSNISHQLFILDILFRLRLEWGNKAKAFDYQVIRHNLIKSKNYHNLFKKTTRIGLHDSLNKIEKKEHLNSYKNFVIYYMLNDEYLSAKVYLDTLKNLNYDLSNNQEETSRMWILDASMEINFFLEKYDAYKNISDNILAINNKNGLPVYYKKNLYLFKGLYFKSQNNIDKAIEYLKIADSLYEFNPRASFKSYDELLFKSLVDIYRENLDFENQIKYLDRLLLLDSVSMVNYRFVESEMIKNFDTPILLEEKEKAINRLKKENANVRNYMLYGGVLFTILSLFSFYIYRQKVVFKKRFNSLLNQSHSSGQKSKIIISEEIVEGILLKLNEFEENKGFRNPDISLNYLSKKFETNSTYLSKVLNVYKEKNFSQYLNELRVDYAIQEIKDNPNFRKYSIEAIANECGYKNATSFSRAFYKKTGIYPSFFVQQLNKKIT